MEALLTAAVCAQVLEKYDQETYSAIQGRVFRLLPLAATVNQAVLVCHGGIGVGDFSLEDIRSLLVSYLNIPSFSFNQPFFFNQRYYEKRSKGLLQ